MTERYTIRIPSAHQLTADLIRDRFELEAERAKALAMARDQARMRFEQANADVENALQVMEKNRHGALWKLVKLLGVQSPPEGSLLDLNPRKKTIEVTPPPAPKEEPCTSNTNSTPCDPASEETPPLVEEQP